MDDEDVTVVVPAFENSVVGEAVELVAKVVEAVLIALVSPQEFVAFVEAEEIDVVKDLQP